MWWIYLIIYFIGAWGVWFFVGKYDFLKSNDDDDVVLCVLASIFWPVVIIIILIILPGYILYQYGKDPSKNPFKDL